MTLAIAIDERFCGPPSSGNGGYVCGLLAAQVDAPVVEATLRRPVPLMGPLAIDRTLDPAVMRRDGDIVIAEARPTDEIAI